MNHIDIYGPVTLWLDKLDVDLSLHCCVSAGHRTARRRYFIWQMWQFQCAGFDVQWTPYLLDVPRVYVDPDSRQSGEACEVQRNGVHVLQCTCVDSGRSRVRLFDTWRVWSDIGIFTDVSGEDDDMKALLEMYWIHR